MKAWHVYNEDGTFHIPTSIITSDGKEWIIYYRMKSNKDIFERKSPVRDAWDDKDIVTESKDLCKIITIVFEGRFR